MAVTTILDDERIAVHHHVTGSDVTVFTFGARWGGGGQRPSGVDQGFGLPFLLRRNFDVVALNPKVNTWYQEITAADLEKISAAVKTRVRGGYGSSMGAYAALMFATALKLDAVLAISPQFDPRTDENKRYPESLDVQFHYSWTKQNVPAFIAYDPKLSADNQHVELIRPFVDFRQISLPYSGHPSGHYLNEVGLLQSLAVSVLKTGKAPAIHPRELRRKSGTYHLNLGRRLMKTRHWKLALALAQCAVSLTPDAETMAFLTLAKGKASATARAADVR